MIFFYGSDIESFVYDFINQHWISGRCTCHAIINTWQHKDVLTGLSLTYPFSFLEEAPVSLPTLSLLTGRNNQGNTQSQTCLAAGFFPENDSFYTSIKGSNDNAQLSTSRLYYYVAYSKDAIEKCKDKINTNGEIGKCS